MELANPAGKCQHPCAIRPVVHLRLVQLQGACQVFVVPSPSAEETPQESQPMGVDSPLGAFSFLQ